MNRKLNESLSLNISKLCHKIYRFGALFPYLSVKAIAKPQYILLCFWAFKQLSWVDRDLEQKAIQALQSPTQDSLPPLSLELKQEIRTRVKAIFWTAKIHPSRPKCLHRSLALYHWLQQEGLCPKLEIGWGNNIGHAWVTYNSLVLNDRSNISESIIPFSFDYYS